MRGGLIKRLGLWSIILGVLSFALLLLGINLAFNPPIGERVELTNGHILHVSHGGNNSIFHENISQSSLNRHDFTFTNIATGEVFHSTRQGLGSVTYGFGNISHSLVAHINLDAGSYLMEFEPPPHGVFVWNSNLAQVVVLGFGLIIAIMMSLAGFILCLVFYALRKTRRNV